MLTEWLGCVFGLAGAGLLATNSTISRYGWVCFLAANILLITFACQIAAWGLLLQQIGFMVTTVIGLKRWFLPAGVKLSLNPTTGGDHG
jgi:hypothetical protein